MKASGPVSMRHVARAAGVAVSTVSKALRNDPGLPPARCRAIQAAAARLGYRPDPLVATLMARLHHRRRRADPQNLAWIDLWPAGRPADGAMSAAPLLRGARDRARELGYGVEVYAAAEDLSPERLRGMLIARGQWGLIIPPVPDAARHYALDLRGLTGVTIGTSLHEPVMHRVSPNHFQGCALAFARLRAEGFTRLGCVMTRAMHERVEGRWMGAFLACQQAVPAGECVAPLFADLDDAAALGRWWRKERPDAVLVAEEFPWAAARRLAGRGRLPVAWLMPPGGLTSGPGHVDYRPDQLGRAAVEMVVGQIHRNERGTPAITQVMMIDAVWAQG